MTVHPIAKFLLILAAMAVAVWIPAHIVVNWPNDVSWTVWVEAGSAAVTAIATVAALFIAIYVPFRQHRLELEVAATRRRAEAQSLAIAVYPELVEIRTGSKLLSRKLEKVAEAGTDRFGTDELEEIRLGTPAVLRDSTSQIHTLGQRAGPMTQRVLAAAAQYERMLDDVRDDVLSEGTISPVLFTELIGTLRMRIDNLYKWADEAIERVESVSYGHAPLSEF